MTDRMDQIDSVRPIDVKALQEAKAVIDQLLQQVPEATDTGAKPDTQPPATFDPDLAALYNASISENPVLGEACQLGWYCKPTRGGKTVRCNPDEPGARPDVARVLAELKYDRQGKQFMLPKQPVT